MSNFNLIFWVTKFHQKRVENFLNYIFLLNFKNVAKIKRAKNSFCFYYKFKKKKFF